MNNNAFLWWIVILLFLRLNCNRKKTLDRRFTESTYLCPTSPNKNYEYKDLYNPEINIELGTAYLAELINKYNGNYYLAVTAYNAGIGVVDGWIANGTINPDGSDIENIPYKETNNYVRKIVKNYKMYKELY